MSNGGNLTLSGRRAVVTGAGRGIGRSIALALAGAGADVTVTARTAAELEQLATESEMGAERAPQWAARHGIELKSRGTRPPTV